MSKKENQVVMRRLIDEAFNQAQFGVLQEHVHPDFVEHQFGLSPTIAGMVNDIQFLRAAFPDFTLTIEDMVADEDKVWVRMTARGTNLGGFMGPPNGKSFAIAVFDSCRFKDGLMVEHWGSPDRFALMAQLGLLPQRQGEAA